MSQEERETLPKSDSMSLFSASERNGLGRRYIQLSPREALMLADQERDWAGFAQIRSFDPCGFDAWIAGPGKYSWNYRPSE
jgi:hypothetical protein